MHLGRPAVVVQSKDVVTAEKKDCLHPALQASQASHHLHLLGLPGDKYENLTISIVMNDSVFCSPSMLSLCEPGLAFIYHQIKIAQISRHQST